MSPEQALGRSALVDHRTDIYSLGVTLYELATLHHPAGDATDVQLFLDRTRFSCKPLRHWNRHIPVDFQTIVLKAIAEFPHERYATAQEFADDLQRFLDGRPILASPPRLASRAAKWAGRHRGFVAAAAAVLLVAFVGLLANLFFVSREKAATDRALVTATENLRETHAVLDRLGGQLGDQLAAIPGAEGVRYQVLEDSLRLLQEFEKKAAGEPALAAELAVAYGKMGDLAERMGKNADSLEKHESARRIWESRVAEEPANAEYARGLALSHNSIGLLLADMGRGKESLESLRKAEEIQRKLLAADPSLSAVAGDLASTSNNLGLALRGAGEIQAAQAMFGAAIELQDKLIAESPESETVLHGLAASYNNLGSLDESLAGNGAAKFYEKAIKIQRRLVESYPINRIYQGDLARTYNNLGYVLAKRSDWKQAELCYGDAIAIQEHLVNASPLAASYRRDLAISYNNLGMAQSRGGEPVNAEESFRQAVRLQQLLLVAEPDDAKTLSNQGGVYNNLGMLLEGQRRYGDAEDAYRQAIRLQRKALAAAPGQTMFRDLLSNHYLNYAKCLQKQDKKEAAAQIHRERESLAAHTTNSTPLN